MSGARGKADEPVRPGQAASVKRWCLRSGELSPNLPSWLCHTQAPLRAFEHAWQANASAGAWTSKLLAGLRCAFCARAPAQPLSVLHAWGNNQLR